VNPYAKIALKIGIVIVICLVLIAAYNLVVHKRLAAGANRLSRDLEAQRTIKEKLDSLLRYKDILPQIRQVQLQDMQTIRNLIPDADDFVLTSYLRKVHGTLAENHLETDGIVIGGAGAPIGGTDFNAAFVSDPAALQDDLERITGALQSFQDNMDKMNNMLISFEFYSQISTGGENFGAIIGGIETHTFSLSVRGSYLDIKKFVFDIFNMRPHTALVGFQMSPQGPGFGATRLYRASFRLVTYGDANNPPPLWEVYSGPTTTVPAPQAVEAAEEELEEESPIVEEAEEAEQ
jgi:Tfp pilus assembly protein PilO